MGKGIIVILIVITIRIVVIRIKFDEVGWWCKVARNGRNGRNHYVLNSMILQLAALGGLVGVAGGAA